MMPNSSSPIHLDVDDVFSMAAELGSRRKSQQQSCLLTMDNTHNYTNRAIMAFVDAVTKMNDEVLLPNRLRDIEVRESDATELMPPKSDLYQFYELLNSVKKDLFSSTLYYRAFQPVPSPVNGGSGSNSGRVTPTTATSRRSSFSINGGNTSPNITSNSSNNGLTRVNSIATPTLLCPPTLLARKLSNPYPVSDGEQSPTELLSSSTFLPSFTLSTVVRRATNLENLLVEFQPQPVATNSDSDSESSESPIQNQDEKQNSASIATNERIQQITQCFMYHLTAVYTIMGQFTRAANYITKRYNEEMSESVL